MASQLSTLDFALPEPPADADNAALAGHWHGVALECDRFSLEAAARCGEVLIEQRSILAQQTKKGGTEFRKWIEESLPFGRATAWRYIALSEGWDKLAHARASLEPLSLRHALRVINGDETDDDDGPFDTSLHDAQSSLRKSFEKCYEAWPPSYRSLMAAQLRALADELEERLHGDG